MKRKNSLALVVAVIVAMIVIGCGGGGGGGGTTTTSTSSTSTSSTSTGTTSTGTTAGDSIFTKVVAQISPGVYIDPIGIQVGQHVQFVLVNFDVTAGTSSQITNRLFTSSGPAATPGNLNSNGNFTATTASSNTYTISTSFQGATYSAPYMVNPAEPRVAGQVVDTNGAVVPFAQALFFDGSGNQVGQATADGSGTFIASVPATAARFNFASSSISAGLYFQEFIYGAGTYDIISSGGCSAPLPALSGTGTFNLPNAVQVYAAATGGVANTPPAPPSCSP